MWSNDFLKVPKVLSKVQGRYIVESMASKLLLVCSHSFFSFHALKRSHSSSKFWCITELCKYVNLHYICLVVKNFILMKIYILLSKPYRVIVMPRVRPNKKIALNHLCKQTFLAFPTILESQFSVCRPILAQIGEIFEL